MGTCPDLIKKLIDRFDQQSDQVRSPDYNEAQLRIDFVNPFCEALGWDMDNTQGFAEQYREVVHVARVKIGCVLPIKDMHMSQVAQRRQQEQAPQRSELCEISSQ